MAENFRKSQLNQTLNLAKIARGMGTRAADKNRGMSDDAADMNFELRRKSEALSHKQRELMLALQDREYQRDKALRQAVSKGAIVGNVKNALEELTTYSQDATGDVIQMKRALLATEDRLRDVTKKTTQQASFQRELQQNMSAAERRLEQVKHTVANLQDQVEVNKTLDYQKKEKMLQGQIQTSTHEADKLLNRVKSKQASMEKAFDERVRTALQKARRNVNFLEKKANGIYKVKNKATLIMLSLNVQTQACTAQYVGERGVVIEEPIEVFVSKLQ